MKIKKNQEKGWKTVKTLIRLWEKSKNCRKVRKNLGFTPKNLKIVWKMYRKTRKTVGKFSQNRGIFSNYFGKLLKFKEPLKGKQWNNNSNKNFNSMDV